MAARPWEFLPVALAALRVAGHDHEMRLHAVLGLARLGMVSAAQELAGTLPGGVRGLAEVSALLAPVMGARAEDMLLSEELIETARGNIEAILQHPERLHGVTPEGLRAAMGAWAEGVAGGEWEWRRAAGGNIVRRKRGSWLPEDWRGLVNARGAAEAFAAVHLKPKPGELPSPLTVEGADPPWVLERVLSMTTLCEGAIGYRPRVSLVQADGAEMLDGLAQADLGELVSDARLEVFVGAEAGVLFSATIAARRDVINTGACIVTSAVRTRAAPAVDRTVDDARATRQEEIRVGAERCGSMYAGRDAGWWSVRYREALSGRGERLRVLIPTCRYSTFVRHASEDLSRAFERAGVEARVLIEPDSASRLSASGYLRAIESFRPDLIVLINYTREQVSGLIPRQIPWITWVQDAMPHLLSPKVGAGMGPLDFMVGHIFSEMVRSFGVPAARCLSMPVVADGVKFHAGGVESGLEARVACDVAYVSHQSQTARALHDSLISAGAVAPAYVPALERIRDAIPEIVGVGLFHPSHKRGIQGRVGEVVREALGAVSGGDVDRQVLATVMRVHALPLAERAMRHAALESAARICARRGWALRIHGNGWASHPTLGAYASGPLEHGDELRASYRTARCHLHVSLTAPVHQRVMECALSGGLPLVRMHTDGLATTLLRACDAAARRGSPTRRDHPDGWVGWEAMDHPAVAMWMSLRQRLGLMPMEAAYVPASRLGMLDEMELMLPPELDAANLLVDPAEVCFWDEHSLERVLERAITDERFRRAYSDAMASRVRRSLTHDALAARMLRFVQARLEAGGEASVRAAA